MTQNTSSQSESLTKFFEFQRLEHQASQLDEGVKALLHENKGIALVSDNKRCLENSYRSLMKELNSKDDVTVSQLSSTSTEALIKMFNQIMSSVSLDTALRPAIDSMAINVLLVNDAHLVSAEQWFLLSQLTSDFPGAQIRFVLVINSEEWSNFESVIDEFKVDMHICHLSENTISHPESILTVAEENGYKNEVEELLMGLAENASLVADDSSESIVLQSQKPKTGKIIEVTSSSADKKSKRRVWNWPLTSLTLAGLIGVMIAMSIFKPDLIGSLKSELAMISEEISFGTVVVRGKMPVTEFVPVTYHTSITKKLDIDKITIERPENKTASLNSIVLSSEDTDYFVQYNVFKEINAAKSYMESNPALEEVQLIDISIADEVYHALLAGPFPSKNSAIFHAMTPGMPKDFWVRNAEPLKDLVRI